MPKSVALAARVFALLLLAFSVGPPAVAQQQAATRFCLNDGSEIMAERFETRAGKFYVYVAGATAPQEISVASVKGVNVPSCGGAAEKKAPDKNASSVPRIAIHGSTTLGERLMPMLIEAYGLKQHGARPVARFGEPQEQEISIESPSGTKAIIELKAHGSGSAARDLFEGKSLIGMSSRRMDEQEAIAFGQRFNINMWAPGNEHVVALDGLAMIVHPTNPVASLSLEQIARIYAGEIVNWSQVGGPFKTINAYRRDDNSGTFDTFNLLVMRPYGLAVSQQVKSLELTELISESVAGDPDGIGFVAFPYINKNKALALTSSCGIVSAPTPHTIKTEEYPLARRLYLYSIGTPSDLVARDFLNYALSDEAQKVVQQAGFVEQSIEFQDEAEQNRWVEGLIQYPTQALGNNKNVPSDAVNAFGSVMKGLRRASVVFRFSSGSYDLDTRAVRDVARLARFLSSPDVSGKPFYIAGFADSNGSWNSMRRLAAKRAAAVAVQLQQQGILVTSQSIFSLSYMSPVACNDTEDGLAKNRRVEVWVAR